jgi:hypothetical protein
LQRVLETGKSCFPLAKSEPGKGLGRRRIPTALRKEDLNRLLGRALQMEFMVVMVPTALFEESSLQQARNVAIEMRPEIKAEKIYRPHALMHRRYVGRIVLDRKAANQWLRPTPTGSYFSEVRGLKAMCG